jgi:fused signal recognition particle receptor
MEKSRHNINSKLNNLASRYKVANDEYFEKLEEMLFEMDLGVKIVDTLIIKIKEEMKNVKSKDSLIVNEILADKMYEYYLGEDEKVDTSLNFNNEGLTVILVVGVNGVGKTTSIAKLAYYLKNKGKKVMLVAGDTFRSGAIEQLLEWGKRVDVPVVYSYTSKDPSSVYFEGVKKAKEENIDVLICDSAGRLQTKLNLMNELGKMKRVLGKEVEGAPHETMLIIDANTGQNGVIQAKSFLEATGVNSIMLTKMDGTSKGGIILAIKDELNIPVKFVGTGEKLEDLEEFDLEEYIYSLFNDEE